MNFSEISQYENSFCFCFMSGVGVGGGEISLRQLLLMICYFALLCYLCNDNHVDIKFSAHDAFLE